MDKQERSSPTPDQQVPSRPSLTPYFTVGEVANQLRFSERTVRRLIRAGLIKAIATSPTRGHFRISQYALDQFVLKASVDVPREGKEGDQ